MNAVEGTTLTCPMHQWQFNLENGECLLKGNYQSLGKIEYKLERSYLLLFL